MEQADGGQTAPDDECLRSWLALLRAPGVGAGTFGRILDRVPRIEDLFRREAAAALLPGLPDATLRYLRHPDWAAVDRDMEWLAQPGHHIITVNDAQFPLLLKSIPRPPPLLFVCGSVESLGSWQLAIVGSRNPSRNGEQTARAFGRHLASGGLTVTSGLAAGIDTAAHRGALEAGGRTIAVLGTGPDRAYPYHNRDLAQRIAENGALVSELPPGTPPLAANFPRRNRLISGLSLGVLVVEAALRSGSLITARLASEQGREVFAIPGSIHNPLSRGCHQLIRQGAKLVENTEHVLEELGSLALVSVTSPAATSPGPEARAPDASYQRVLSAIGYDPISIDELVAVCQLTPEELSSMLLIMELEGQVSSHPGGRYTRSR